MARSVAEMLNANTIGERSRRAARPAQHTRLTRLCLGGKKGSRWRDDVWTMKYLPRFRWDQLSEQVGK